ncbi:MAG: HlyC/CorC family transporter [Aeriscardovia sp.]|nr:HlyC/CorC family transporter [Aeriscardovia sp.]
MPIWFSILLIIVFQILGGVFSCTEMTLITLRDSQIEQMGRKSGRISKIIHNPNRFLSAVQIGTTFTGFLSASFGVSLILPVVVPPLVRGGMNRTLASNLMNVLLTLAISYLAIVISEMVPKRIAMQKTVEIANWAVPFVNVFAIICYPLIWLISSFTNLLVRIVGLDPHKTESKVSQEELKVLVSSNTQLNEREKSVLEDVFDAANTVVSEVMRPRADVVFLEAGITSKEAEKKIKKQPYTRYPVIGEDFDDVLGYISLKDLMDHEEDDAPIKSFAHPISSVPGTSRILPTLGEMREKGADLAVVIDEYGGTDGIVTLMDMVEEVINGASKVKSSSLSPFARSGGKVEGGMTIEDFADLTGIKLEDGPYETVAGYFLSKTGSLAKPGDVYHSQEGYDMVVTEVEGRRIQTIEIRRTKPEKEEKEKE